MDTATLLVLEGALIGALVGLRYVCMRVVDLDEIPRAVVRRIELGNRFAPWVAVFAVLAVVVGVVMMLGSQIATGL